MMERWSRLVAAAKISVDCGYVSPAVLGPHPRMGHKNPVSPPQCGAPPPLKEVGGDKVFPPKKSEEPRTPSRENPRPRYQNGQNQWLGGLSPLGGAQVNHHDHILVPYNVRYLNFAFIYWHNTAQQALL